MKRLTVFVVMTLALAAALLIGAGGTGSEPAKLPPYNPAPLAVVKSASGPNNIQFGELAYGKERYLVVINADCDSAVNNSEYVTLHLYPGPGRYQLIMYRASGSSLTVDTVGPYSTNQSGLLVILGFGLGRGGSALIHIDPVTPTSSYDTLFSNSDSATYAVNGRKIAVDRFGRIHVCYNDVSNGIYSVWYARSDDLCTTWVKQRVADSAICPAIAVDTFGVPWISYMKHPTLKKLYLWSEGFDTAAVVINIDKDSITNAPAVALDFGLGLGVVYYSSKFTNRIDLKIFELPSVKILDRAREKPTDFAVGPLSCCITPWEEGIAAGLILSGGSYCDYLSVRNDYNLTSYKPVQTGLDRISGNHGDPSLSILGSSVYAVYYEDESIRYKRRTESVNFPSGGSGTQIVAVPSNCEAKSVQICENFPFIVWSNYNSSSSARKIYYTYRQIGDGISWSTPARVSATDTSIAERYPHVDHDYDNKKIYVIWTQYGGGASTSIGGEVITYESLGWDSVRVIHPNGMPGITGAPWSEGYPVGELLQVAWELKSESNPDSSRIYANFDYPGGSWDSLATVEDDATVYDWYPQKTSDSCRVKVEVYYASGHPYDISDDNFRIIGFYIGPEPWPVFIPGEGPSNILTGGGLYTLPWQALSFNGLDTTNMLATVNRGGSFSFVGDSCSYDSTLSDTVISGSDTLYGYEYTGTTYWTAPSTPTSYGYLRLMAVDTTSDTVYSYDFYPFRIPPPGGFQYNTYSNQNIMSLNDNGNKIGLVYTAQDPDTADKLSVVYMESDEGLGFSAPDTVGLGCWPSFSHGACFWQNFHDTTVYHPDTLFYAYQLNDTFATPYPLGVIPQWADSGRFSPVGFVSENDTVHAIIRVKIATHELVGQDEIPFYSLVTLYAKFLEASPGSCTIDTLQQMTSESAAPYTIGDYAASVVKRDSVVYGAYDDTVNCYFATITPSGNTTTTIGQGSQPSVSCSEGNITYTYLGSGDTSHVRLWRYLDDTTWVERDTFYLDDDAEVFCGEEGLMYGVQREDTFLADLYVYDPISEEYYLTQEYTGYYPHTYLDDEASEFAWITAFADYVDSSTTYMHTERHDMNVILPALYQEADDKRSPYTLYRDTCIHYTSVDVDSAADSLIYRFPHLNTSEDYAVIVEFYTECDSITQLQVTVGSTVDTIQIPANSFSWYEQNVAARTDTLNLAIRRISQFGFVPVSRVLVRRRSSSGFFMSAGGPQSAGPVQIPFCLYQPFPNPFADAATIRYSLPYATHVSLKIYDVSGRLVSKLVDGEVAPGVHQLRWTGKDDVNRRCASGVYFVRFTAGDYQASKKMVLIK